MGDRGGERDGWRQCAGRLTAKDRFSCEQKRDTYPKNLYIHVWKVEFNNYSTSQSEGFHMGLTHSHTSMVQGEQRELVSDSDA